ncbi:membrane-associated oxidoreductase [Streptomyces sp. NBC_01136]|uniref:membrane-associated oxidoreductase n=1 Tax=unclassified Streptomyces TaxID=2593676 RepID=UPI0032463371|nr:membrane-associated oxidoreductase [Streptomyces sp. NBC_01136]
MDPTDLTPAERRVWEAFPLGEGVDFREGGEGGEGAASGENAADDPAAGASWGPERTVRAEVLRALLLGAPARDGEIAGLKLTGARLSGQLDLRYGTVEQAVQLRFCHFEQAPKLYGARLRALVLSDSVLPGFRAGNLRVDGVLRLSCCRISGPVLLQGAKISGAVFVNGARLGRPTAPDTPDAPATPDTPNAPDAPDTEEPEEPVLQLNHADIGTDVWAVGLVAHGQVRLNGATVGGLLNLDDAELYAPPGETALHAETLAVGTDLRARRLRVRGRVNLSGARIPRQLDLTSVRLSHPGGQALRASSCVIGELWLSGAAPIVGTVNLRRSQLDLLHVPPGVWPDGVRLDGLSYRTLAPRLPVEQRLPLLEREEDGYLPYAYEQLATAYRTAGDDAAARTVQLAKLRRHRRTLPRYARFWGRLQDVTVGYGFRPMRAAGWLLLLLCTGATTFALHPPHALKPAEAPDFNPVFYTVDLLLPLIDFGQEAAFAPSGWYQWLSYLLIATGWILATTIAAGVTRSLNRQ